jgi:GTP-binding protein
MQFIDEITVKVAAGNGGDGCVAMLREKYRPFGGPNGGNGGNGGDIIFKADERLTTLLDFRFQRLLKAEHGEPGRGSDQYGRGGETLVKSVPVGTQIFDDDTGELIADLSTPNEELVIVKGGRGGRGNMHFATATERAPMFAEDGIPGEHRSLRMELKLLADVGIVGFPNAGKSTLISTVSRARPKVADYPFTTLAPQLGVVSLGEGRNSEGRSFVLADIPGIIEGAAEGAGLGIRFLKHIERTRVLLFLIGIDYAEGRDPLKDLETLRRELKSFDNDLAKRPAVIAFAKLDLPEARAAFEVARKALKRKKITLVGISSATREGIDDLLLALEQKLDENPIASTPRPNPLPTAKDSPHRV